MTEEIFNTALSNLEFLSEGDSMEDIVSDRKNSLSGKDHIPEIEEIKI